MQPSTASTYSPAATPVYPQAALGTAEADYSSFGGYSDVGVNHDVGQQHCSPAQCAPCCETSCFKSPCDECGRNIAIDVSSVFMYRSNPDNQRLLVTPTNTSEQMDASEFDFGVVPGIEAGLIGYDIFPEMDLELRALWVDDWSAGTSQSFTGSTVLVSAEPPLGTSGPRDGLAIYDSRFLSTELNARYRNVSSCQGYTFVLGVRSIRLDERLNTTLADPSAVLPDEIIQARTNNRLVGLQIGADRVFANKSNWCLKFTGRAGVYGNNGHQRTQLISLATPPVTFPASGGTGNVAFQAELGVSGRFRLSPCANLVASYRAMFIDGVALASDQLAATDFLTQSGYDSNGSVLFHAATVGLELVY